MSASTLGEAYRACVSGLSAFMRDAGFTDVLIGLSGGMDSSLVAVMCADALGADRVHGALMPGPYTSDASTEDAFDLAARLGVHTQVVPISGVCAAVDDALANVVAGGLRGVAAENVQARCRMVCLMALSNAYGWMLVNTGNKSESLMGYSTLYGDAAGAYAPIGSVFKTDVYALARWRNALDAHAVHELRRACAADFRTGRPQTPSAAQPTGCAPIPVRVFEKPPSAELSPGQSDESALGIDYASLDAVLAACVERGASAEDAARASGVDAAEVARIMARVHASAFKRAFEPPAPEVALHS